MSESGRIEEKQGKGTAPLHGQDALGSLQGDLWALPFINSMFPRGQASLCQELLLGVLEYSVYCATCCDAS